jgi:hypothetical protein
MTARKTFIEHTKNQSDKYAIGWRWTTQIIDFREYDKFNMNSANRYVGIPDGEEHRWKNGWYSCEYNESLNWLLSVGLVEIVYDELEEMAE